MEKVNPEALEQMKARLQPGVRWAAYQNKSLDSANTGHMQFLAVGGSATYAHPTAQYPADTVHGMGWRYRFIGMVDLETGEVIDGEADSTG
jgi:hypothetical protein